MSLDGQTISGRKGIAVIADEAMDEAERRALAVLADINPELAAREDAAEIARRIGIGAIRFAKPSGPAKYSRSIPTSGSSRSGRSVVAPAIAKLPRA